MPAYWAAARSVSTLSTVSGDTNRGRLIAGRRATSCSSRAINRRPVDTATRAGRQSGGRSTRMRPAPGHESVRLKDAGLARGPAESFPGRARVTPADSANLVGTSQKALSFDIVASHPNHVQQNRAPANQAVVGASALRLAGQNFPVLS